MFPTGNDFESEFTFEQTGTPVPEEPPFHVLLLGDWSGHTIRTDLEKRRPIVTDRDNLDDVIKQLQVSLELDLTETENDALQLRFSEFDDFHPDNLYRDVPIFSELRDIRRRLNNPDSFEDAARVVRAWFDPNNSDTSTKSAGNSGSDESIVDSGDLLDMILEKPSGSDQPAPQIKTKSSDLAGLVSQLVSPHLIRIDEKEQSKLISVIDEAISKIMRAILHHPKFQALESAWRGLYFLVRRLETNKQLKVFILDLSQSELITNLSSVNGLADSFMYRWTVHKTLETQEIDSFAVVGGNYSFHLSVDDVAALIRIAKISAAASAPFISHLNSTAFGVGNISEIDSSSKLIDDNTKEGKLWLALRTAPESRHLGLSPMRVLARLPFGESADSLESFNFEELDDDYQHESFVWMNPCFPIVSLLAQSFSHYGWRFGQSVFSEIDNLPSHIYRESGETKILPNSEMFLSEMVLEKVSENGLISIISFRDTNKLKIPRFRSVSSDALPLSGKWQ